MRGIIFDLDDTLFPESTYVESGFQAVAERVHSVSGLDSQELLRALLLAQQGPDRGQVFDALFERYPAVAHALSVPDLVRIYRAHRPKIDFYPGTGRVLAELSQRGLQLGLISDGPLEAQAAKMEALSLCSFLPIVILTDAWGREFWKPHERAYREIERRTGLSGEELAYVADNPMKDFVSPRKLGWLAIRLRREGQVHFLTEPEDAFHAPHLQVSDVEELREYVVHQGGMGQGARG